MKVTWVLSAALSLVATAAGAQNVWEQCGGKEWAGETSCVSGSTCHAWSDYYSQCVPPDSLPSTAQPPTSSTLSTSVRPPPDSTSKSTSVVPPPESTSTSEPPPPESSSSSSSVTSGPTSSTVPGSPAPSPSGSIFRVRLSPSSVAQRGRKDADFAAWTVQEGTSSSTYTQNGVTFTLSGNVLDGAYHKIVYNRFVASLGELVVGEGITTDPAGNPITLTIKGLPVGTHSLLTWHNSWDAQSDTATLSVSVDGSTKVSNVKQTVRLDNYWTSANSYVTFSVTSTSQTVKIVYTPSGGTKFAYINGFEINTPTMANQVSFPTPANRDERIDLAGGTTTQASWRAASASGAKYNVYFGKAADQMRSVSQGQTGTSITFTDLDTFETYFWRVDVVVGGTTYIGRVFYFRARQLAFPGAEGWGRWARGGRKGQVVKVTSLADNTSPGTLRYALSVLTGPRIVVFDVAGVITLTSRLVVNNYVTIAGQTAPGKGIVVQGWPVGMSGSTDVIMRHMRVRPGKVSGQTVDGMGMTGSNHCIMDRCSMGWAIDESFSSRSGLNLTFQRNMISEPLNAAGHSNYPPGSEHGFAATISGDVGSFHHNLIAHAQGRSWSMGSQLGDDGYYRGKLDLRNNVVYNFGGRVTDGSQSRVNFVNNYYKKGPASTVNYAMIAHYEVPANGQEIYHCAGNVMPGVFSASSAQYSGDGTGVTDKIACWARITIPNKPTYQKFYSQPLFESYVTTQSAEEAYKRVLSDSGASQPAQDDHDKRIVKETRDGTTTYTGSVTGKNGLIDDPKDAGGLESFPTTTRPSSWDADNDGIADWWDGSTGGAGWTPIEGYINFMAEPHSFVSPSKSVSINLGNLAAGFKSPTFTASGPTKGTVTVSGSTATYTARSETGIDYVNIAINDSEGSTWTIKYGIAIFAGAN